VEQRKGVLKIISQVLFFKKENILLRNREKHVGSLQQTKILQIHFALLFALAGCS
jgi:hypothetical protein